ncbi:MAG: putative transcription factor IIIC-gamma subunit [Streblomastix strix]|uniref:Putative transcription factor IIIC-gamma subunit n=1 Tax=Streblomastix strix TaxID=222440 RepID=A0A5J4VMK0_9EUKA|nr:MAG: putative transcription factor IIIC-gamma subunit [Streblomastix strix]
MAKRVPEKVSKMMGEAVGLFIEQKFSAAIAQFHDIIRAAPTLEEPYNILGIIYEELGNAEKALEFYLVAAHMSPENVGLWLQLSELALRLGKKRDATYCLQQVLIRDPKNIEVGLRRVRLLSEMGEVVLAKNTLRKLEESCGQDKESGISIARELYQLTEYSWAARIAEKLWNIHYEDLNIANILCDLLVMEQNWEGVLDIVENVSQMLDAQKQGKKWKPQNRGLENDSSVIGAKSAIEQNKKKKIQGLQKKKENSFIAEGKVRIDIPIDIVAKEAVAFLNIENIDDIIFSSKNCFKKVQQTNQIF